MDMKKGLTAGILVAGLAMAAPAFTQTAAFAAGINTHQLLEAGDRGQAVSQLQTKLHSLNLYNDGIDGIYGPYTKKAVESYQRSHHLAVDGIAGPNTLGSLFSSSTSSQSLLKYGDRGQSVVQLQSKLADLGFYPYSIDGIYGRLTENAVRSFQKAHGLTADGIDGPHTSSALNKDAARVSHIISDAKALIGTPYVYGGESPSGFDCSGFVQYVYSENGISVPRTAAHQWKFGSFDSTPIPGDLVFFNTTGSGPSHVGIYIGNRQFIQAGSTRGVKISSLDVSYWANRYLGAKSVF